MKQNLRDVNPTEVIFKPEASAEPLFCTLLPDELHLCSLPRENRALCAYGILKLVFFCENPHTFFSVSETEDEISMLMSKEALAFFPDDAMTVSELWRPIQRFKKTSYTEIGVISALSAPISRANVPILYASTFLSAYIFVQQKNTSVAVLCLESQKFRVQEKTKEGEMISPRASSPQVPRTKTGSSSSKNFSREDEGI
eukprot:TRINITY_DN965_c0_g2_i2.p1 TRINITY_DN965_c0_g2~~TRINITY_DN965_c0_g2_i2.p1  ORF type:complete len:199 (-),score=35.78 TRINITY_DN965_c0_g2_i2:110-706(-)